MNKNMQNMILFLSFASKINTKVDVSKVRWLMTGVALLQDHITIAITLKDE